MPALAIFGITGRMGQSLLRALRESPTFTLTGAMASGGSERLGEDAACDGIPTGVRVTADLRVGLEGAEVAVDFSSSVSAAGHAQACAAARVPILIGTTGLDPADRGVLESAARTIPVLIAPNTSVGVGVMGKLATIAARGLGLEFDVEILEVHHRMKRDTPSGTALALGEAVAQARGQVLSAVNAGPRADPPAGHSGLRIPGSIGFASSRAGDIVGEHTVIFAADGERVEITHRATDRMIFARGALRAAAWLATQPPGLYGMSHVLGF